MRNPILAIGISGLAALALSSSQPLVAQSDVDQQLGNVSFKTSCNEVAQRRFDRAHALSALVLVQRGAGDLRGGPEGRSELRHRALGHRARAAEQSAQRDPGCQPGARACRHPEGQGDRRQDRARARLHRRPCRDVRRLRQAQPWPAHPRIPARRMEKLAAKYPDDDEAQIAYAITLNTSATSNDKTYAQQTQGRGDPRADLQAPAAASGRHALPDPPLRLSGDRGEGPRCRQPLRQDRAGRAACPAHAVAHLHPRRLLEGVDQLQHRLGEGGEGGQVGRRPAARQGLHGLCPSPARPGQGGARRHRRDAAATEFNPNMPAADYRARGLARALRDRAWRLERRGATAGPAECLQPGDGDHALRPRARRGALRQAGRRQGRHRQARGAARQAARGQGRLLVRASSTSSGRSPTPGCCTPRASTTRRSKR